MVTAAIAMVSRQQFDVRRSANLLSLEQGLLYQQGIEGWAMQILRRDRPGLGHIDLFGRLAHNLTHLQAPARQRERAERCPVVAAGAAVDLRCAAELTAYDEQDLFIQTTQGKILD